jgi:hypothetical protein
LFFFSKIKKLKKSKFLVSSNWIKIYFFKLAGFDWIIKNWSDTYYKCFTYKPECIKINTNWVWKDSIYCVELSLKRHHYANFHAGSIAAKSIWASTLKYFLCRIRAGLSWRLLSNGVISQLNKIYLLIILYKRKIIFI